MFTNVAAKDIRIGMFVAELDRPWTDTPFLLQGFLVEDEQQVAQLQSFCKFVLVDRERSAGGVLPETRDPDTRTQRTIPPESRKRPSSVPTDRGSGKAGTLADREALILDVIEELGPGTEPAFGSSDASSELSQPGFFESLREGIGILFRKRDRGRVPERDTAMTWGRPGDADKAARTAVHYDFIPRSIPVKFHPETKTIEQEMPQARQAFAQVEKISRQLVDDIRAGRLFSVEELEEVIDDVVDSALRSPDAMMLVTRLKDQDVATYGHSLQVSVYMVALGRHLGLPKEELANFAILGLFLDMGKTKVPAALLSKPGPLTPDEFELVKQHVSHGMDLIRQVPGLDPTILEGVAQHHEREDGSGYPGGLPAESISLYGRMAAIVDTYVALTNPRPHAAAISAYDALRKLSELSGHLFYAPLVEQLVQTVGVFPVGSRVELSTGEVAIVLQQGAVRRLKPKVLVISGPDKVPLATPTTLDLLYQPGGDESVHIARGLPAGSSGLDARK
jgi:HD-GYP domain-containing protein (c-di-GMP phosphodiesterase class II)